MMSIHTIRATALLSISLSLALGTAACGVRKPPRSPEATMPVAPPAADARILDDGKVLLRWKRPPSAADGQRLYDLAGFELERRTDDDAFELIATVPVNDSERIRPQQVFKYLDATAPAGAVDYRVRAFAADGQRGEVSAATRASRVTPKPASRNDDD